MQRITNLNTSMDASFDINALLNSDDLDDIASFNPNVEQDPFQDFSGISNTLTGSTSEASLKQLTDQLNSKKEVVDPSKANYKPEEIIDEDLLKQQLLEEQSKLQKEEKQTDSPTSQKTDDIIYDKALELLKDYGYNMDLTEEQLEGLTEEKFEEILFDLREKQKQEALNQYILNNVRDEKSRYLLELAAKGADFSSILEARTNADTAEYFNNLDVENEQIQKELITRLYKEGLDPNIPAHEVALSQVDSKVEEVLSKYEGKKEAEKARNYFISQINKKEEIRVKELEAYQQQQILEQKANEQKAKQWQNEFMKQVQKYPEDTREKILGSFQNYYEQDNNKVPEWYYKYQVVLEKPELFTEFLKFISNFDLKSQSFINQQTKEEQKDTKEKKVLFERLMKHSTSSNASKANAGNQHNQKSNQNHWVIP